MPRLTTFASEQVASSEIQCNQGLAKTVNQIHLGADAPRYSPEEKVEI